MRLTHTRLLVDDYPACFRFYRDVLGLEVTFGDESSGYADLRAGDGTLAIFERDEQAEVVGLRLPGDSVVVVLTVDDVDAEAKRLEEHVIAGPFSRGDWGGRVAYLRDPSANLIELHQSIPMTG